MSPETAFLARSAYAPSAHPRHAMLMSMLAPSACATVSGGMLCGDFCLIVSDDFLTDDVKNKVIGFIYIGLW
jgi:hypothetical protein